MRNTVKAYPEEVEGMGIHRWAFVGGMLLTLVVLAACDGAITQPDTPDWRAYGEYLRQRAAAGRFSGAVLVAKDGQPVFKEAYGMADREHGLPNTAETKFCIASMGKMFTAVAIAQLVEQGKLSFDDPIGKYVSGFPPEIAGKVTIHHLLTHTSGIVQGRPRPGTAPEPPPTIAAMMEQIVKRPLQFEPGSQFGYSNDGYIVLGAIIQNVTGQAYAAYVTEHLFKPAGMTDTTIPRVYKPAEVPNMAHGYMLVDQNGNPLPRRPGQDTTAQRGTLRDNSALPQRGSPAGGAYSTVEDMLKFAQALIGHKLLSPAMTDTVLAGKVNTDRPGGPAYDKYAYGFAVRKINGVRIVGHSGGTPGYEAQLDIYPAKGYTVVILTNQDRVLVPAMRRTEEMLTR